ncbi:DNA primase [Candidatus Proelusimicrobium excrementi]|uniref:DNA primase n=1 Tax=Candidatus Proelusimicrobium excrementi TaxID=3416222 RepID=UPI003CC355FC|nr:DNA primase [Elusimicrobiaceae bacterium]
MNTALIEKIKDSIDILELIKEYVPAVKRAGRTYKACCPFHQEKTPSFTVNPDKGFFYCFGCQAGGDVFEFLMRIENLSFNEAVRRLAERAGIPWREEDSLSEQEKGRLNDYKLMNSAKDFYHRQLLAPKGQSAVQYLQSRKINADTVNKFQLGLSFFDGMTRTALKNGYTITDLKKLGLTSSATGTDYFKNRLMFPIFNHRGDCVAFGGRVLSDGQPKYLNSPETPLFSKSRVLYALNFAGPAIRREGKVILLEGYMDVIACHQAGAENCVAPLGTSFTPEHAKLLKRYTDTAVVLFDPDEAGIKASLRAALILVESGVYVKVASLTGGLDPDEYIHKYGLEDFKKVVNEAKDIVNFRLDCILKGAQSISPKDRADITAEIIEIIQKQPDQIIKNEWALIAANRLGVQPGIITEKLKRTNTPAEAKPVFKKEKDVTPQSELDLIRVLLKFPRYVELCAELKEDYFENKNIWLMIKEIEALRLKRPDIEDVLPHIAQENEALAKTALKYAMQPLPDGIRPQREAEACINTLKKTALSKRYKQLQQLLSGYPPGGAPLDLLKEQIEIQKKLKS